MANKNNKTKEFKQFSLDKPTPQITEIQTQALISNSLTNFAEKSRIIKGYIRSKDFVSGVSGWNLPAVGAPQFNDLTLGASYAVGSDSRNATTGTQSITGIGFTPKLVKIIAVYAANPGGHSVGHATTTSNEFSISVRPDGTVTFSNSYIIDSRGTGNNLAELNSLDSDGFTLNWVTSTDLVNFGYECYA